MLLFRRRPAARGSAWRLRPAPPAFELAVQLAQDILDPGQVLARVGQAVFGFAAALFIARHAGSLFQEHPQFFGARLDQAVDHALADDGVAASAQAGAQEDVVDVAAADLLVVDEIAAGAVAGQHPAHRDLGVGAPRPAARPSLLSNTISTDARAAGLRLPEPLKMTSCMDSPRSSEALASPSTQRTASMMFDLPQPAHHAHQLAGHGDHGGIDEGLEAGEF